MATRDLPQCSKIPPPPPGRKQYKLSEKAENIVSQCKSTTEAEQFEIVCELIKNCKDPDKLKKIMNLARDSVSKFKNRQTSEVGDGNRKDACGVQSNVHSGAPVETNPGPPRSSPASQVPLICRGDLIATTDILFLDTEKVTVSTTHANMSGDVAIVDVQGRLLFWSFINQPNVCKFNTQLTGLDKAKMKLGLSPDIIKSVLEKLLDGKTLWGASISEDLKSLNLNLASVTIEDIQHFYRDYKNQPISLALLSQHFLGENMHVGRHSSIADARMTAICYQKMLKFREIGMLRFSCPVMDELRSQPGDSKKNTNIKYDRCTCGAAKNKFKYTKPLNDNGSGHYDIAKYF